MSRLILLSCHLLTGFRETLGWDGLGRFNWVIRAYCQMTNHYHLLVEAMEETSGEACGS